MDYATRKKLVFHVGEMRRRSDFDYPILLLECYSGGVARKLALCDQEETDRLATSVAAVSAWIAVNGDQQFEFPGACTLPEFLDRVADEVAKAREKFPSSAHNLAALIEEKGELVEALMANGNTGDGHADVLKEATQTAAMAVRIVEEGDADYGFAPEPR